MVLRLVNWLTPLNIQQEGGLGLVKIDHMSRERVRGAGLPLRKAEGEIRGSAGPKGRYEEASQEVGIVFHSLHTCLTCPPSTGRELKSIRRN